MTNPIQAVTIDAVHSMDLDDAIWVERDGVGWDVTVVIANVAKEVHKGDRIDEMAANRVATRYFAEGNAPMLPRQLAELSLSLHPDQPRQGMVIRIKLDGNLIPLALPVIAGEPFTSSARLDYLDVPFILADDGHPLHKAMMGMARLAEGLMARRREAGALAMYDLNKGWFTTEDGTLRQMKDTRETIGQIIVQELMILANAELARYAAHHSIPILFRNHTAKPHAPNRMEVVSQLELALQYPDVMGGLEVARQRMVMTMNRANYGAILEGHYGLNLPAYIHATSPIRRYADLVNQRQILRFAKGDPLPYDRKEVEAIAAHINAKIAADAEDTTDFYRERDTNRARKALVNGQLDALDTVAFERVVKTCVRYGYSQSDDLATRTQEWVVFSQAVRDRLQDGRISLIDIYFLLMEAPMQIEEWDTLRGEVLRHLADNLHKTPSVASVAMNLAGWSEITYDIKRSGPDHTPTFDVCAYVTLKGGHKRKSGWVQATNTKTAKQLATMALLSVIAGVAEESKDITEEPKFVKPVTFVPLAGGDPVASLQEYAQKFKLLIPDYAFVRAGGPDHAPLFTCTCTVNGVVKTSPAMANKKAAKKEAACMMLATVLAKS